MIRSLSLVMVILLLTGCLNSDDDSNVYYFPQIISRPDTDLKTEKLVTNRYVYGEYFQDMLDEQKITDKYFAVAELMEDGSVITWGGRKYGGYSWSVRDELYDVVDIIANSTGFIAIRQDEVAIPWGSDMKKSLKEFSSLSMLQGISRYYDSYYKSGYILYNEAEDYFIHGWPYNAVLYENVAELYPDNVQSNFLIRYHDAELEMLKETDGFTAAKNNLINLTIVRGNSRNSWAAVRGDGLVVTWGEEYYGGVTNLYTYKGSGNYSTKYKTASVVGDQLYDIEQLCANGGSFAALRNDGVVITWGRTDAGAGGLVVSYDAVLRDNGPLLENVEELYCNYGAFTALKHDDTVVSWGYNSSGGDTSYVDDQLYDIVTIEVFDNGFRAYRLDEEVIEW